MESDQELQRERRRYALLRAAATMAAGELARTDEFLVEKVLDSAEEILWEIERREKMGFYEDE